MIVDRYIDDRQIPDLDRCLGSTSSRFIQINTCVSNDDDHYTTHGDDDHYTAW